MAREPIIEHSFSIAQPGAERTQKKVLPVPKFSSLLKDHLPSQKSIVFAALTASLLLLPNTVRPPILQAQSDPDMSIPTPQPADLIAIDQPNTAVSDEGSDQTPSPDLTPTPVAVNSKIPFFQTMVDEPGCLTWSYEAGDASQADPKAQFVIARPRTKDSFTEFCQFVRSRIAEDPVNNIPTIARQVKLSDPRFVPPSRKDHWAGPKIDNANDPSKSIYILDWRDWITTRPDGSPVHEFLFAANKEIFADPRGVMIQANPLLVSEGIPGLNLEMMSGLQGTRSPITDPEIEKFINHNLIVFVYGPDPETGGPFITPAYTSNQ